MAVKFYQRFPVLLNLVLCWTVALRAETGAAQSANSAIVKQITEALSKLKPTQGPVGPVGPVDPDPHICPVVTELCPGGFIWPEFPEYPVEFGTRSGTRFPVP